MPQGWEPVEDTSAWEPVVDTQPEQHEDSIPATMARQAKEMLQGAAAGATSTVFHGGELIRSGLRALGIPQERVIDRPEVKSAMTAPDTAYGKIGKFAEQTAEMIGGTGIGAGLTAGAKLLPRIAAQAAAPAAVTALQTGGDPTAMAVSGALGAIPGAVGGVVEKIGQSKMPQRLYQSALKPPQALQKKAGEQLIKTGLEEGIPVSSAGLQQAEHKVNAIRREISQGIQLHAAQGAKVDSSKVLGALDDLEDFYMKTAAPEEGLNAIQNIRDEFVSWHGQQIPVDVAQQIKINTYNLLRKSYGDMKSAKIEGLKQVARGIKEQISSVFPEISKLNENQSEMLDLTDALHKAVWRIENRELMGLGSPMAASAGGALLGGPGAAAGFVGKLLLENPNLKSKLAIALHEAGHPSAATSVNQWTQMLKAATQEAVQPESEE